MAWMRERCIRQDSRGKWRWLCREPPGMFKLEARGDRQAGVFSCLGYRGTAPGREMNFCVISQSAGVLKSWKWMRTPSKEHSVDKVTKKSSTEPRALLMDQGNGKTSKRDLGVVNCIRRCWQVRQDEASGNSTPGPSNLGRSHCNTVRVDSPQWRGLLLFRTSCF